MSLFNSPSRTVVSLRIVVSLLTMVVSWVLRVVMEVSTPSRTRPDSLSPRGPHAARPINSANAPNTVFIVSPNEKCSAKVRPLARDPYNRTRTLTPTPRRCGDLSHWSG